MFGLARRVIQFRANGQARAADLLEEAMAMALVQIDRMPQAPTLASWLLHA